MTDIKGPWYTRKAGNVSGPFNRAIIQKQILTGRLSLEDEVSIDAASWQRVRIQSHLIPDVKDKDRTRRFLDERTGVERRKKDVPPPEGVIRKGERRQDEDDYTTALRAARRSVMQRFLDQAQQRIRPFIFASIGLVLIALLATLYPTTLPTSESNCQAMPAAGINWNNCLKSQISLDNRQLDHSSIRNAQLMSASLINADLTGSDLAYSNFRFARLNYSLLDEAILKGADLSQADLSNASLRGADLSYANLNGAQLNDTDITDAKLDRAIWVNGLTCEAGSVGQCLLKNPSPSN
jgi:hypothetical protein